ncbi:MAG: DUF6088 family protein [Clostridiales bacterium]|nr:DUF6088 family protein [Clostridiales bacterium]
MKRPDYLLQIEERIKKDPYGTVYVSSDFADITDRTNVSVILSRLEEKGLITRAIRGVYYKPTYSEIIGEYIHPYIDKLAYAIARQNGWTIVPSGNKALNELGLSTQVPAKYVFMTDGPSKTYYYKNIPICFKHVAKKDIAGLSFMTAYVIQALKTLGKEHINEKVIRKLSEVLSDEDKEIMLKEAHASTSWVYETIRAVCSYNQKKTDVSDV